MAGIDGSNFIGSKKTKRAILYVCIYWVRSQHSIISGTSTVLVSSSIGSKREIFEIIAPRNRVINMFKTEDRSYF